MKTTSHQIDKNLYLIRQMIDDGTTAKPATPPTTNHVAVIDVSGSMSNDLPKIREQLKKKLPKLLRDGDTFSMIWFSGRGQCGVLVEAEPVATLKDLADINQAIDRWLRPVGMTGFKEPLEEAEKLIAKIGKKHKQPFSLFFMSDGCDNQWSRPEIIKAVEKTAQGLAAATFVEYGYYADRNLLAAMAEKAGGTLIFAEHFDKYQPVFERVMQQQPIGGKRIEVKIQGDPIGGFVFARSVDCDLLTFEAKNTATVPEGLVDLYYLSPTSIGEDGASVTHWAKRYDDALHPATDGAYAALSLFAVRMKPEIVYPILKALGDVAFINRFAGCFGKQKYSEFMDIAKCASFDLRARFTEGFDPSKVPADDAFTVLDLLRVLSSDPDAKLLLDHESFKYNRISRARVDADENLSAAEQEKVEAITAEMAKTKGAKRLKELQAELATITDSKQTALKFNADAVDGYSILSLTYNEERPNISVLVRKTGWVDLSARLPSAPDAARGKGIQEKFQTNIWRNYAIVKDGLVNVAELPVKISRETFEKLQAAHVVMTNQRGTGDGATWVTIDLQPLPILNRRMVKAVSAKNLFELEYELTELRADQKVYGAYQKEKFPKVSANFTALYGADGAAWLKDQGLTDGGFAPKQVQAESTDVYMGKELSIKLKGFASLPSVKDVRESIKKGKTLSGGAALMADAIQECESFFAKNPEKLHEKWLDGKLASTKAETRGLILQKAQQLFGVIVGQVWPSEFKSLDENTLEITVDGQKVTGTIAMNEVEIKI